MTHFSAPFRVDSPCINVCVLDAEQSCVGCGRHVDDIGAWSQMTPLQRHEANVRAAARRELNESQRRALNALLQQVSSKSRGD